MKRKLKIIIFGFVILLIMANMFYTVQQETYLSLTDSEHHRQGYLYLPENSLTLTYIHSVHRTPVAELFTVDPELNLVLRETRFSSLGVGMPYTAEEGRLETGEGEFRLTGLHRPFPAIAVRVSAIPEHAVQVGEVAYPLLDYTEPGGLVTLKAVRRWRLTRRSSRK